jgi:pathogenesis-related protein 1
MNKSKVKSRPYSLMGLVGIFLLGSLLFIQSKPKTTLSKAIIQEVLDEHNKWRHEVKVDSLQWSDELAKEAQAWADKLAKSCSMRHSNTKNGENIFWSSYGNASATEAITDWASEKKFYKGGKITKTNYRKVGHYTQIVWSSTTHVGAGHAICKNGGTIWVCQYAPAGNFLGQKPY